MQYSKINTDNHEIDLKLKEIETQLGISMYVVLEIDENKIIPVLKYYNK